jgi:SAM-dependent methyltransferase
MEDKYKLEEAVCPLCQITKFKKLFMGRDRLHKLKGEFQVVQCRSCGFRFTNPRPTPETIVYFYPPNYNLYQPFSPQQVELFPKGKGVIPRIKNELKYRILKKYYRYNDLTPTSRFHLIDKLPGVLKMLIIGLANFYIQKAYPRIPDWTENGKALEIGCANGAYLLLLKKLGWHVEGIDIINAVTDEVKNANIPIYTGELKEQSFEPDTFDLIVMWHVFEHLHSPLETLLQIHRMLVKNGSLLIEVPNSASLQAKIFRRNWFPWELPRHLNHFSPKHLFMFLEKSGFEIVKKKMVSKNYLANSLAYWLEEWGMLIDVERLNKNKIFTILRKSLGLLLSCLSSSEIIFVEARKL